jgi:AcrR family transcriptional regulator
MVARPPEAMAGVAGVDQADRLPPTGPPVDPPPSEGRRYVRARARTRGSLLAAARHVMADSGVEGATIADIAARAGVSPGTFYNYFRDLPAVLDALVDELIGYIDEVLDDVHRQDLGPFERFALIVDRLLRLPEDDPAWAWCLVRFEPTVLRLRDALCERIAMAPPPGRRRPRPSRRDAVNADVLIGTVVTSMLSRLQGRVDSTHNHLVAEALLRALGLSADEAHTATEVLRRPPDQPSTRT